MECTLCKIQYVGKAETSFNIRLNNHRIDANGNNPKAIPASIHFKQPGHNFNKHAKFTLIEQINTDIDTIKIRLKRSEYFWILKLETLTSRELNQKLNNVNKFQSVAYFMFISVYHLPAIAATKETPYKEILSKT